MIAESPYGKLAVRAADSAGRGTHPVKAWQTAALDIFHHSISGQQKNCPKSTFLGLAEAGEIVGIEAGHYTRSKDNKRYAIAALKLLRNGTGHSTDPVKLWALVMALEGSNKEPNHQMDVICALWRARKFVGQ